MTERTYGRVKLTLDQLVYGEPGIYSSATITIDLVNHIRELEAEQDARGKLCEDLAEKIDELQTENAKLAYRISAAKERKDALMSEVIKIKAEWREFGMRVAEAVHREFGHTLYPDLTALVEQELNK